MKLPNLRLPETQAKAATFGGILGLILCAATAVVVFHNLDRKAMVVAYNDQAGMGVYRQPLIYVMSMLALLIGLLCGVMGFNSLGQKRNTHQSLSWLGMFLGAIAMALAPVLIYAWKTMAEPIIQKTAGG